LVRAARTWDISQDGSVTCDEWRTYAGRLFSRFDADGDGYFGAYEYGTMSMTDRLFDAIPLDYFDADNDERVSRTEFVDKPNAAFTLGDRNKDCTLDITELVIGAPPPGGKPPPAEGAGGLGGPGAPGR
jgi:hypothetical protein